MNVKEVADKMKGTIIEMNKADAFVSVEDGTTQNIDLTHLPNGVKVGDTINVNPHDGNLKNDTHREMF